MLFGLQCADLASHPCEPTAIYGYGFQRLVEATGPVRATLILLAGLRPSTQD